MNKAELVEAIVKKTKGTKADTEGFINTFVDVIKNELKKGGEVTLVGFGSFKVVKKAARIGRNPKTGAELKIPARKSPKFTAGKGLKDAVK
jgi:DNA-binding protein HU-beta